MALLREVDRRFRPAGRYMPGPLPLPWWARPSTGMRGRGRSLSCAIALSRTPVPRPSPECDRSPPVATDFPMTDESPLDPGAAMLAARAENVVKEYGSGAARVTALAGVSVGMPRGRFTAVMGPSGS